jgi:hypothetical protein
VFRRMRKIHALKLVPGSKDVPNPRSALRNVSCTRSSASWRCGRARRPRYRAREAAAMPIPQTRSLGASFASRSLPWATALSHASSSSLQDENWNWAKLFHFSGNKCAEPVCMGGGFPHEEYANRVPMLNRSSGQPNLEATQHQTQPREPRRNRPAKLSELHGLGRHGPAVDDGRRRADIQAVRGRTGAGGCSAANSGRLRLQLRPDQRQPHRLQQSRQPGCDRNAEAGARQDQRLPGTPDLLLHTGDITHSSKPAEFDTAQQLIKGVKGW